MKSSTRYSCVDTNPTITCYPRTITSQAKCHSTHFPVEPWG